LCLLARQSGLKDLRVYHGLHGIDFWFRAAEQMFHVAAVYKQKKILGEPGSHRIVVPQTLTKRGQRGISTLGKSTHPIVRPPFINMSFAALPGNSSREQNR
tara:strand:- start:29 stop:331 length:303 start_codon:yes stop_codon:yes gene_type:complete